MLMILLLVKEAGLQMRVLTSGALRCEDCGHVAEADVRLGAPVPGCVLERVSLRSSALCGSGGVVLRTELHVWDLVSSPHKVSIMW